MRPPAWRATYRLQFHEGFTFGHALAALPYLEALGISHVYASPIFAARPGSTHGYDVTDPTRVNPALGGEEGLARLAAGLAARGMGLLLDIVPNHMAADADNACWMAALAGGPHGPAADIFDIDWAGGPIRLPFLGETLAESLAAGQLALGLDAARGWITVSAYDGAQAWPIRAEDAARLLAEAGLDEAAALWRDASRTDFVAPRQALRGLDGAARAALAAACAREDLAALIARQHWRPAHWRSARDALSWRRFFNITELVGVRVEQAEVFALVHELPLRLLREGLAQGLRIDHIDGLADPAGYCRRLRAAAGPEALIVVEKILGHGEALPADWPVDGTTGYERLNLLNGLFVSAEGHGALAAHLRGRGWVPGAPEARLRAAKRQMLAESFEPELAGLLADAQGALAAEPGHEFGPATLRAALAGLLAHCPVYRSYLARPPASAADDALWAAMQAGLAGEGDPWAAEAGRALARRALAGDEPFRRRFQQLSGPLMAKGLEDTEFYRAVALLSANEVGGEPGHAARTAEAFHALCEARAAARARDLTPLATHDTKRGPDARARLDLLAADPEATIARHQRFSAMTAPLRRGPGPDEADEWLIYQAMLGAWPVDAARFLPFLTKALREAKRHTRWEAPDAAYEESCLAFARALLEAPEAAGWRVEMARLEAELRVPARLVGLAQTILHLSMPGVPDVYQGSEWWDTSLVDPDNRRPVDYAAREAALAAPLPGPEADAEGLVKQRVIQRLLRLRAADPAIFEGYARLSLPPGWLGFTRGEGRLLVAVPTRPGAEALPPFDAAWRDALALPPGWPFFVLTR